MDDIREEERRRREHFHDTQARYTNRENELNDHRNLIESQQREFDAFRRRVKEEQLSREAEFQKEREAREEMFLSRERKLALRMRDHDQLMARSQEEAENLRLRLQTEITEREARLQQAENDLAAEKERYTAETRQKIERSSKDYVADAITTLSNQEIQFHNFSKLWGGIGALALLCAIVFFVVLTFTSTLNFPQAVTWEFVTFSVFKGLVVVALLGGLAKYSFLFSSSYMQESLKNADRRHAINFGKFYLESYGAAADWSQVKEAFEHWNITGTNAFARSDEPTPDISALEKAANLIETATKNLPKMKSP